MDSVEEASNKKARKITEALMSQFDELDVDYPEFRDTLRTMSFHEAKDICLYLDDLAERKAEFENMRSVLRQSWLNKKELEKMNQQEVLAYYIENLISDLLYERYEIIHTL